MAWTESDIPDLSGRTAVVTGANGGLGLETSRALARAGAHVVMAARNQVKAATAEASIREGGREVSLEVVALDLASLESVRDAAERLLAEHARIDILVNNAGVMAIPEQRTAEGFEMQFGVNHLGHFALTARLLPALLRAQAARVVSVTSTAHHMGRAIDSDDPHLRAATDPAAKGGEFYAPRFVNFGAPVRRPILRRIGLTRAIERLWQVSERETKLSFDVAAAMKSVRS